MGQTTFDWTLGRVNGAPHVDGYSSQDIAVVTANLDYNLGANSVYQLMCTQDFYFALIDLTLGELGATATRSVRVLADTTVFITTTSTRKTLSVLRVTADGTLKVIKMEPGAGQGE